MILHRSSTSVLIYLILALVLSPGAKAVTMGEAATTVTVTTVAGAILGASTLPFYEDSGKNTKNIFYGAAVGAVVGVLISAYSGVQDGRAEDEEEANARVRKEIDLANRAKLLQPEHSTSLQGRSGMAQRAPAVWSSIANIRF
ncbi:MAG: hypothetical protein AB7K68_04990 [Bacteriovoracia bacterium]